MTSATEASRAAPAAIPARGGGLLRQVVEHRWDYLYVLPALVVMLVVTPGAGVLVITWLIGWYAVVLGLALLGLAWEVRRESSAAAPGPSARPGTPHPAT